QGISLEEVKEKFENGLASTIQQHLSIFGSIDKLLAPAPHQIWKNALTTPGTIQKQFFQVSVHKVHRVIKNHLPFKGIDYLHLKQLKSTPAA
ncbi:MAG: hypothetical protein U1E51_28690, partial [Candidatus Binatia bacterium]|nr:hypothetical protein [Candidatus Binatia bacterium]